ncbi:nucleophile aminohydrolase [Kickxella alabastrina]|uniref:nucleophile aminohydrolase n=1 Tax=Kickxella alabastrina TaxID=61397 RepID=UPI0022211721|nr:nucleophile aminohydrolase [Kickxella alabastrina]KAI7821473.1 nucleophile aminohydrolase [Kickxella alabastrina]
MLFVAICNPIQAANAILKCYSGGPDCHLGLVPPMLLVGKGADAWAHARGIETNNNTRHKITEAALGKYEEYMNRITNVSKAAETEADLFDNGGGSQDLLMDTVGAVCVDSHGNVAAGVSSGGIALKYPGRVGEVSIYVYRKRTFAKNTQVKTKPNYELTTSIYFFCRLLCLGVDAGPKHSWTMMIARWLLGAA